MQKSAVLILALISVGAVTGLFFVNKNDIPQAVTNTINSTPNKDELSKVIDHYQNDEDSLKLKAAYFLIGNMDGFYSYDGAFIHRYKEVINIEGLNREDIHGRIDSLKQNINQHVSIVRDIDIITSDFLIENIELAFKVWQNPWAKNLTFDQFCEYILPYRVYNEPIEKWRQKIHDQYKWVYDSLQKDKANAKHACSLINNELKSWFFHSYLNYPYSSISDLFKARTGTCTDMTYLSTYTMRAMGVPVVVDYTPNWANRSLGHIWNAVLYPTGKSISFMGAQNNPGLHKLEFYKPGKGIMRLKKSKVFRRTFAKQSNSLAEIKDDMDTVPEIFMDPYFKDVTNSYIPVSDVSLKLKDVPVHIKYAYICTFDNVKWVPVHWSLVKHQSVLFNDMGTGVAYTIMYYKDNKYMPLTYPFVLDEKKKINFLIPNTHRKDSVRLLRKFPINESNEIQVGELYALYYWDQQWKLIETRLATDKYLDVDVPENALFLLRNLSKGIEERIFTIDNETQVWW